MPDFRGFDVVYIQPGTSAYPLAASFPAASSATANDGARPYGTTITSAEIKVYKPDGTELTSGLVDIGSVTVDGDLVRCTLSYPTGAVDGLYTLEYRITLDTGAVLVFDARRVWVGDRSKIA